MRPLSGGVGALQPPDPVDTQADSGRI